MLDPTALTHGAMGVLHAGLFSQCLNGIVLNVDRLLPHHNKPGRFDEAIPRDRVSAFWSGATYRTSCLCDYHSDARKTKRPRQAKDVEMVRQKLAAGQPLYTATEEVS